MVEYGEEDFVKAANRFWLIVAIVGTAIIWMVC